MSRSQLCVDPIVRQAAGSHLGNQVLQSPVECVAQPALGGPWRCDHLPSVLDAHRPPLRDVEPSFRCQQPVRFGNGVVVNAEVNRQPPHGGQLCARGQFRRYQQVAQLIGNLPEDGCRRVEVDREVGFSGHDCIKYADSIQCRRAALRKMTPDPLTDP
jgi:hypothetical protein